MFLRVLGWILSLCQQFGHVKAQMGAPVVMLLHTAALRLLSFPWFMGTVHMSPCFSVGFTM